MTLTLDIWNDQERLISNTKELLARSEKYILENIGDGSIHYFIKPEAERG